MMSDDDWLPSAEELSQDRFGRRGSAGSGCQPPPRHLRASRLAETRAFRMERGARLSCALRHWERQECVLPASTAHQRFYCARSFAAHLPDARLGGKPQKAWRAGMLPRIGTARGQGRDASPAWRVRVGIPVP